MLRWFFGTVPPFGVKEDKKHEFPDALALLSLEAWAERNDTMMLVVSNDGGWKNFADASGRLICVNDLVTALDYFKREESRLVAQHAIALLQQDRAPDFHAEVEVAIEAFLDSINPHEPHIEAWSARSMKSTS